MKGDTKKIFGILPVEVILDKRLTLNDLRVYAALSSFQGVKGFCFPKLDKLAGRSGVHQSHLSKHTKRLEQFGLIEKTRRGRRISNVYFVGGDTAKTADSPKGDYAGAADSEYAKPAESDYAEPAHSNNKTTSKTPPTTPPEDEEEVIFENKYFRVSKQTVKQWEKAYPQIKHFQPELVRVSDILDEKVTQGETINSPMAFLHKHLKKTNEELMKKADPRNSKPPGASTRTDQPRQIGDVIRDI